MAEDIKKLAEILMKGIVNRETKLEKIREAAKVSLNANYCNNCDGVGLPDCIDEECATFALDKIMQILDGEI